MQIKCRVGLKGREMEGTTCEEKLKVDKVMQNMGRTHEDTAGKRESKDGGAALQRKKKKKERNKKKKTRAESHRQRLVEKLNVWEGIQVLEREHEESHVILRLAKCFLFIHVTPGLFFPGSCCGSDCHALPSLGGVRPSTSL